MAENNKFSWIDAVMECGFSPESHFWATQAGVLVIERIRDLSNRQAYANYPVVNISSVIRIIAGILLSCHVGKRFHDFQWFQE
jgi:hypothetical protein